MAARLTADRYAYARDGYHTRYFHAPRASRPDVLPRGPVMRRFTIVQRDGRFVIEEP